MRDICHRILKNRISNTVKKIKEFRRVISNSGFIVTVLFTMALSCTITIIIIIVSCNMTPLTFVSSSEMFPPSLFSSFQFPSIYSLFFMITSSVPSLSPPFQVVWLYNLRELGKASLKWWDEYHAWKIVYEKSNVCQGQREIGRWEGFLG